MGTARSASTDVMITIGRTSTASVAPPAMMLRPVPDAQRLEHGDEDRQAEQPVDDGRHAGQVADVDLMNRVSRFAGAYSSR